MGWVGNKGLSKLITLLQKAKADVVLLLKDEKQIPVHSQLLAFNSEPLVSKRLSSIRQGQEAYRRTGHAHMGSRWALKPFLLVPVASS